MASSIGVFSSASLALQGQYATPYSKASSTTSAVTSSTPSDSVSTGPQLTPTGQPGVYISREGYQVIKCDEVLTASDKKLVEAINGGQLTGGSIGVSELVTDIATSRVTGMLTGDVTPSYVEQLLQDNAATSALDAQQASLYAREGNSRAAQAYSGYAANPGVPNSILEKALQYLTGGTA